MITDERMADAIFARHPNNGYAIAHVVHRPARNYCRAVVRMVWIGVALTDRDKVGGA